MQTATEKSKAAIEALVSGQNFLSAEQLRHLWLSVAGLTLSARDAEHSAFLMMMESENKNLTLSIEAEGFLRNHLNKIREQMTFIRSVLGQAQ
jgi:hypothetical protein